GLVQGRGPAPPGRVEAGTRRAAQRRGGEGRAETAHRGAARLTTATAVVDQGPDRPDQGRRGGAAATAGGCGAIAARGSAARGGCRRGYLGVDARGLDGRAPERPRRRGRDRDAVSRRSVRLGRFEPARLRL